MPALPSGTVTFLFTDIEGSTRMWDRTPVAMRTALARHDRLLRSVIEAHDGCVFKTIGDAFCAAFGIAHDALRAAIAAQRALYAEVWEQDLGIRVRMALHTGNADERDGDYYGPPLNRIARLLAVGHGGQILLSGVTRDLIGDRLPEGTNLQDEGQHRLRDLTRPEHIFQLLLPDLPGDFPPLRSLQNPILPNNLPCQTTPFIGRERQVEEIKRLLGRTALLTLTGAGGCGKTRLGLQVAADLVDEFPDGAWLIELAQLTDPALVPLTLAQILNLREETGRTLTQTLIGALQSRKMLLVLDNCEHLVEACARLVNQLLRACPEVKILTTSLEALGIAGEITYRVPSLALPVGAQALSAEQIARYEAVRLFAERAVMQKPSFVIDETNAADVAEICARLDGIPLAIELAAARVRSMSVAEINRRLNNRFALLTGGNRIALPRQQTLRGLIDWSYELLPLRERALFHRLSVFTGSWTLEAAEAICADPTPPVCGALSASGTANIPPLMADTPPAANAAGDPITAWEVLDLLSGLANRSLVVAESEGERTRFRFLETVRQYSREKLPEGDERDSLYARHRDYYLTLAEEAGDKLYGPDQGLWFDLLEREHDNLRAALTWCQERGEAAFQLRLTIALARFWDTRGYLPEGRQRFDAALAANPQATPLRAQGLLKAGWIGFVRGEFAVAHAHYHEATTIYNGYNDLEGKATALHLLGLLAKARGDLPEARTLFEEVQQINREREAMDPAPDSNLGEIAYLMGDYSRGRALLERALATYRQQGEIQHIAAMLRKLGYFACCEGDYAASHRYFIECLQLFQSIGSRVDLVPTLLDVAQLAVAREQWERAARLIGATESLRKSLDLERIPANATPLELLELVRRKAPEHTWDEGRAMTLELAVNLALVTSVENQVITDHCSNN